MKIKATIIVEPIGKARPRHRQLDNGRIIDYIPEPTRKAEWVIQTMIRRVVMAKGKFPPDVPVKMEATFYRLRPKHLPKRVAMPISRPDLDNYYKLLADSLEKFVYQNDSQITTAIIKKRFGDPPRIELLLEEDSDE